jgi:hypothetical protein
MKKVYLSVGASAILASLTFVGCGSSSSSPSSSTGTLSLNPKLSNIDYICGSNSGTTNDNGEYKYSSGDDCTFTFGGLQLNAKPGANLTIDDILEESSNSAVSKEAIWAYVSAATGLTQAELSSAGKAKIPDTFKSATNDIDDFSSFDNFSEKLLADSDVDSDLKTKFEKNKGKIPSAKTSQRVDVKFTEIVTPTTEESKNTQQVTTTVKVNGVDQTISYNTILRTGDTNNGEIFGQVKDYTDTPITFSTDGSPYICNGTNDGVGSGLDYTSFLNKDGKIYMVSQFECGIGAMYMAELNQNPNDGALTIKDNSLKFISQKDEFGGFVHCAGQRTPWETHLGSEEYETNAKLVEKNADAITGLTGDSYYDETAKYWGNDATKLSPYYYGWTPEVNVTEAGEPTYTKHYSMGRFSHELSYVMPDNKTVYMSDDGTNVGLFMFVADVAKDLSAGTLYAAKWNQTSPDGVGAGEADLTWVNLGHATDAQVRDYLDKDKNVNTNDALKFSDIFDSVDGAGGSCDAGYTSINTSAGHECLKVKEGMEVAASRLETRRYAAIKGATTEFRKEEGITFDKNSGKLYVSMSEVKKGMENDSSNDLGGNNHIRVAKNSCGAVYALDVSTSTVKDTSDSKISSSYVVENMYSIIEGTPTTYDSKSIYANNTCNVNGISNPDNISFLENSNILTIGEDTSSHENNTVWAYNTKTKELTRTFTTPLEAESTSTFWYTDLKDGFGYMSVVTQHPGADTTDNGQTAIGYIGAFKNLTTLNKEDSINSIEKIGTYKTTKQQGSEIVAFDKASKKMFTTNGADNSLDITPVGVDGTLGTTTSISLAPYGAGVQSVTAMNGKVAVAVGSTNKVTQKGKVVIFDTNGALISQTQVGYLPDMVTFNEDGTKVIVANEGEPDASSGTYVDVAGTIGIVTVASTDASDNTNGYAEVDFSAATLTAATDGTPVRLGGTPSNNKALDIEPEYITVSGNYAYVTLQENNAVAKVNISGETPTLELVKSFGAKDYTSENTIDIEEEGYALLKNYNGLYGLYMPDSIASYTVDGSTYLVTANEGDGREYCSSADAACDNPIFADEKKISKLDLSGSIAADYANENDLKVMTDMGEIGGVYEKLYTFGARSFTIWDENGELVWDSGDEFAKLTSKFMPTLFNQDDGDIDGRSGNKGVEPEALAVGKVGNKTYAFVGFERQNVIVVYDITVPTKSKFVKFINTQADGDISPEGMKFVEASNSPTGNALLFVAFEMSGSTSIFEIK